MIPAITVPAILRCEQTPDTPVWQEIEWTEADLDMAKTQLATIRALSANRYDKGAGYKYKLVLKTTAYTPLLP